MKTFKSLKQTYKILIAFLVFLITISLVYILLYFTPGRQANSMSLQQTSSTLNVINEQNGYTGNFLVDYGGFLKNILTFNFGISSSVHARVPVNSFLWSKMGLSFAISGMAVVLSVIVSIPLSIWFSRKPGKLLDNIGITFMSVLIAVPAFIFAILVVIIANASGHNVLFDFRNISTWIIPIITLSAGLIAQKTIYLRSELIKYRGAQFTKFAKAKGLTKTRIEFVHILKISLFPIITFLPQSFLMSFMGSILIENIFGIPGSGTLLAQAIQEKDFNVVEAMISISVALIILSFALRDITLRIVDPRVKYD